MHRDSCGCTAIVTRRRRVRVTLVNMVNSTPRELGISALLLSIYVSARGGASVAGTARRFFR